MLIRIGLADQKNRFSLKHQSTQKKPGPYVNYPIWKIAIYQENWNHF